MEDQSPQTVKVKDIDPDEFAKALLEKIEPHIPAINDAFNRFAEWLAQAAEKLNPVLEALAQVDWKKVKEEFEAFPDRATETMRLASRQGWFFNLEDSLESVFALERSLRDAKNTQEIDELMVAHHNGNLDYYLKCLTNAYPSRRQPIEAAIRAHKDFKPYGYSLSVPVFLAQADGIFSELAGLPSAMDKVRNQKTIKGSEWVKDQIGEDENAKDLLSPILDLYELDILKSTKERNKEYELSGQAFNALNRHQVMHGEVSDYGNEVNSAKALSFLIFIAIHMPGILDSTKKPTILKTKS